MGEEVGRVEVLDLTRELWVTKAAWGFGHIITVWAWQVCGPSRWRESLSGEVWTRSERDGDRLTKLGHHQSELVQHFRLNDTVGGDGVPKLLENHPGSVR